MTVLSLGMIMADRKHDGIPQPPIMLGEKTNEAKELDVALVAFRLTKGGRLPRCSEIIEVMRSLGWVKFDEQ